MSSLDQLSKRSPNTIRQSKRLRDKDDRVSLDQPSVAGSNSSIAGSPTTADRSPSTVISPTDQTSDFDLLICSFSLSFSNAQSSTVTSSSPTPNSNSSNNQSTASASTLANQQQQQQLLQDNGEPPFLAVGTEVSAKYKGAFCEARIQKVERLVKCRVTFKNNLGTVIVTDDNIKGPLRVGASIEAKHPDKNCYLEATISKIIDASQYTVIFDDGDITTLRRTSLCLKSGKHFAESESLDHLPLTNPEHFGNPVSLNARGNRRRRRRSAYSTTASVLSSNTAQFSDNDDESIDGSGTSVDDEDSSSIVTHQSNSTTTTQTNYKLNSNGTGGKAEPGSNESLEYGKVICVDEKRSTKLKDLWFPGLIVLPSAQENSKVDIKENYLVKSFVNGRFYPLARKDAKEFTKELGGQILNDSNSSTSLKSAIEKALNYLDKHELPPSWDYEALVGSSSINENGGAGDEENESSSDLESLLDDELDLDDAKSVEEKDRFVAQLYKYMDERGTPINKTPTIWNDDLDLYNLYRLVDKMNGYNRVTNKNGWKTVYNKLLPNNETATQASANQLRLAYKKYLLNFVDFFRKLGCTMVDTCMYSSRTGTSRTARSERNWRNLSEQSAAKPEHTLGKDKTRRKKSTATNESVEKKEEDEKKPTVEEEKSGSGKKTTAVKRARKYGRKKFKLGAEEDSSNVNGNEPEEKYIPNDSDFESDSDNFSTPTIPKESTVAIGDRIRVKYGKGKQLKVYEAKVMNVVDAEADDPLKIKYFVHYTGWNTRYDEWITRHRIVEIVCDKSPKRRGGNKSKNKGVPLSEEQQAMVQVKPEPVAVKLEPQQASAAVGKRGRPSAGNFRNQPAAEKPAVETKTTVKNEPATTKKPPAASPTKRSRGRSECLEVDPDDNEQILSVVESTKKGEEMEVESGIEKQADTEDEESVESKEPDRRYGYKKLKRSDSFRSNSLRRQEPEKVPDATQSDDESASRKSGALKIEEDPLNRRKQRKKKNDKTATAQIEQTPSSPPPPLAASSAKEKEDKPQQQQQPQSSAAASAKKRKAQGQQNVSSSGDEDDSNSSSNMGNKFSKRKRILNSKYRQDSTLVKSEPASSSSSSSLQSAKEAVELLPRKRSKEESVKSEKLTSQSDENQQEATRQSAAKSSKETEAEPATVASSEQANNFLLCKEEIPASPSCDENSHQQPASKNSSTLKNSSTSDQLLKESKLSSTNKQPTTDNAAGASAVNQKSGPSSLTAISSSTTVQTAKLCSTNENSKEIQNEKIKTSVASSVHSNHKENSTTNDASSPAAVVARKESDDAECVQFTPPTTPESLKSSSTVCSHNDKDSNDEKTIHDKNESCETTKEHGKIETHGLDMIASATSKLDEMEKQNSDALKKENLDAQAANFSPRKKRRGRGRTMSQSEQADLFNASYNREKESLSATIKELSSSIQKVKGCKTRGSLGRKVKQNQNVDCTSESTSHSDNFEPTSPSILNCISLDFYNPTSKYNFCVPLDESLETDKRIQILQERLQELRKTYLNIKSELATIERRRKKCKRKERSSTPSSPGSQTEHQKSGSPQSAASSSSSSNKESGLQRSNSFSTTENSTNNHLEASEPVC